MKILLAIFLLFAHAKTSEDVTRFLESDLTNTIPYSAEFDCVQFSETLVQNARKQGFDAAPILVALQSGAGVTYHEFVVFTVSEGVIWIEPQHDAQYVIADIGEPLCEVGGGCVADEILFIHIESQP